MAGNNDNYSFSNLKLWQHAQDTAVEVISLVDGLPVRSSTSVLVRQVVGSVGSIGSNIAEGHGRYTWAAYRNHLSIAKGSACETDSWINLLQRLGHVSTEQEQRLHQKLNEIIALLTYRIRKLDQQAQATKGKLGEERADYIPGQLPPPAGDDLDDYLVDS